jgi:general secretion pathway protein C
MNLNLGRAKQWELCAVLVSVLVSAPVVARAGEPKPEQAGAKPAQAETRPPVGDCPVDSGKPQLAIRQIDPKTYEVTSARAEVPLYCGLGQEARIVPAFKEGVSIGLKLFAINPGSTLERAGLRNKDVVLSLNGMPLSSPEKALEADRKLRDAERIEADIERDGKRLQLTYLVKRVAQR